MTNLKLNLKEFSGTENIKYWVTHNINNDGHIWLHLNINFMGKPIEADSIFSNEWLNVDSEKQEFDERLEYVLKEAEEKWNLKLTKEILNVA